jgi:hypothetical protein
MKGKEIEDRKAEHNVYGKAFETCFDLWSVIYDNFLDLCEANITPKLKR